MTYRKMFKPVKTTRFKTAYMWHKHHITLSEIISVMIISNDRAQ